MKQLLKKINILYIIVPLLLWCLVRLSGYQQRELVTFYGFAENRETQINRSEPVEVKQIHVIPGQEVKEGELLLEVAQSEIPLKLESINANMAELSAESRAKMEGLRAELSRLEAEKAIYYQDIQFKIKELQTEIAFNQSLIKGIADGDAEKSEIESPKAAKLRQYEEQLKEKIQPIDYRISGIKSEIRNLQKPYEIQLQQLERDKNYYENRQQKLLIKAPSDGLIGNIHVKHAEHLSSFSTLITFYEENPTLVQGFIHENLILKVALEDEIEVVSSLYEDHRYIGKVVGLGSRIVEIPERLRKMPDVKVYGREVLIEIPADNNLLQKERVILNLMNEEAASRSFLSLLFG